MTENLMSPSEIKKAQTSWRRRRGALQRNDWHYQLLLQRTREADRRVIAIDRQAGFYQFWNRVEELTAAIADHAVAREAWREASREVSRYETQMLGQFPTA